MANSDNQSLSSQNQSGQTPIIVLDEAGDLQVIEILNYHASNYSPANYGDVYPGMVQADGLGTVLYNNFVLIDWTQLRYPIVKRTWQLLPGSWVYSEKVDEQTLSVVLQKKRKNVASNIKVGASIISGSSGALTAVLTAGVVSSVTITNGGTRYAEIISLVFSDPPSGVTTEGYALTVGGIINSVIITTAGSGYGVTPPTVTILSNTVVATDRQDVNKYLAYEIVTMIPQPTNYSFATALPSDATRSMDFPQRIDAILIKKTVLTNPYWRRPSAANVPVRKLTYWVVSKEEPVITLDSIIYGDPIFLNSYCSIGLGNPSGIGSFNNVLHDEVYEVFGTNPCGLGNILIPYYYPATTPSYSQYEGILPIAGTSITLTNGSTALVGVGTTFTSSLQAGDKFQGATILSITDDLNAVLTVNWGGATETITASSIPLQITRPGAGWVGTYKNIYGSVTPIKYQLLWEIVIESIIMR